MLFIYREEIQNSPNHNMAVAGMRTRTWMFMVFMLTIGLVRDVSCGTTTVETTIDRSSPDTSVSRYQTSTITPEETTPPDEPCLVYHDYRWMYGCPDGFEEKPNPESNSSLCESQSSTSPPTTRRSTPTWSTTVTTPTRPSSAPETTAETIPETTPDSPDTSADIPTSTSTADPNNTDIFPFDIKEEIERNKTCAPCICKKQSLDSYIFMLIGLAILSVFIFCCVVFYSRIRQKRIQRRKEATRCLPSTDDLFRIETQQPVHNLNNYGFNPSDPEAEEEEEEDQPEYLDLQAGYEEQPDEPYYVNAPQLHNMTKGYDDPQYNPDPKKHTDGDAEEDEGSSDSSSSYDYPDINREGLGPYIQAQKLKHKQEADAKQSQQILSNYGLAKKKTKSKEKRKKSVPEVDPRGRLPQIPDPEENLEYSPMYIERNRMQGVEVDMPPYTNRVPIYRQESEDSNLPSMDAPVRPEDLVTSGGTEGYYNVDENGDNQEYYNMDGSGANEGYYNMNGSGDNEGYYNMDGLNDPYQSDAGTGAVPGDVEYVEHAPAAAPRPSKIKPARRRGGEHQQDSNAPGRHQVRPGSSQYLNMAGSRSGPHQVAARNPSSEGYYQNIQVNI